MKECIQCGVQLAVKANFCFSCGAKQPEIDAGQQELEALKKTLMPGTEVLKKIGQGGMADIYLGKQVSLDRLVVIKLLYSNLAMDEKIREKFLLEARVAANLDHSSIVNLIDQGSMQGRPYFIMEYAHGGTLKDKLSILSKAGSKLAFRQACEYILLILSALENAHSKSVLAHRDLKPDNILFRENGELFLSDFGIALLKGEKSGKEKMGTPGYMSPEQILCEEDLDQRSDLYSAGILFFELLTGKHPYAGSAKDIEVSTLNLPLPHIINYFNNEELAYFKKNSIDLEKIQSFIEKACAKNKEDRFVNAKDMAQTLKQRIRDQEKNKLAKSVLVKNRKKIKIFAFLASILLGVAVYMFYVDYRAQTCSNCCVEGNCETGFGVYRDKEKKLYRGSFLNGKRHGKGMISLEDGTSIYEGDFELGELEGEGVFYVWKENEEGKKERIKFLGEFKKGKIEGEGAVYFKDGSSFYGIFKDGEPTGDCSFITMNKDFYVGQCLNMLPDGNGLMVYRDKSIYEGSFKAGKRHGKGKQYRKEKILFNGTWKNDNAVE
jgi:hypothetical protein